MLSRKDENGIYRDIVYPIDNETRDEFERIILIVSILFCNQLLPMAGIGRFELPEWRSQSPLPYHLAISQYSDNREVLF